jgi:D-arabinose 1-dehydrogenase-like Zn-dependent alcohol dehydrogenase
MRRTCGWSAKSAPSPINVTRADVREMLAAAAELGLRPTVEELPLVRAGDALDALRRGEGVRGARVLRVAPDADGPRSSRIA